MHRRENGEHKGIAVLSAYIHITVIVNKYPLIAIACILNISILCQIGVIASRSGRGIEYIAVCLSGFGTELVVFTTVLRGERYSLMQRSPLYILRFRCYFRFSCYFFGKRAGSGHGKLVCIHDYRILPSEVNDTK